LQLDIAGFAFYKLLAALGTLQWLGVQFSFAAKNSRVIWCNNPWPPFQKLSVRRTLSVEIAIFQKIILLRKEKRTVLCQSQ
jgi:hypothetical protein